MISINKAGFSQLQQQMPDEKTNYEYIDTTDCRLEQRISKACRTYNLEAAKHCSSLFLNSSKEITTYFSGKKRLFQTDFYKHQRQSRNLLMGNQQKPLGGKWTCDDENRLKYPKGKTPPKVNFPTEGSWPQNPTLAVAITL